MHEGPARISKLGNVPLKRGMILSNEPGYYKAGAYGIRIENLVLVTEAPPVPDAERPLNTFETLTLAPIDRRLIDIGMLTESEISWIEVYHARWPARWRRWWTRRPGPGSPRHPAAEFWLTVHPAFPPSKLTGPALLKDARQLREQVRTTGAPVVLLLLLMAATSISATTLTIIVPALPELTRVLKADPASVQLTVSLFLVGLAAAQLVMGPLSDRSAAAPS